LATPEKKSTSRIARVVLVAISVFFAVIVAEVSLRIVKVPSSPVSSITPEKIQANARLTRYDRELGWIGASIQDGMYWGDNYSFPVRQNSHGLRGPELDTQKQVGKVRVLVLGDSQTWGLGVPEQERYSDVLQSILNEHGMNAEVLNFGVPGYGTDQELMLFKTLGKAYHPDLVILGFFWNDLFENSRDNTYGHPKPRFVFDRSGELKLTNVPVPEKEEVGDSSSPAAGSSKDWLRQHSRLYELAERGVSRNSVIYSWAVRIGLAAGPKRDPASGEWKVTVSLLQALRTEVDKNGSKFLIVVIPEPADLNADAHSLKAPLFKDFERLPVFDPFQNLDKGGSVESLYFPNDMHLRPLGHKVLAKAIADYLLKDEKLLVRPAVQTTAVIVKQ